MKPINLPASAVHVASVDLTATEVSDHLALGRGLDDVFGKYSLQTVDTGEHNYGKTLVLYNYVKANKWLNPIKAWVLTDKEAAMLKSKTGRLPMAWQKLVETGIERKTP